MTATNLRAPDSVVRSIDRVLSLGCARATMVLAAIMACAAVGSRAHATPPPVITSVTVTSYSTGDNHSIALPQTQIPELVIRGTNFFTDGTTPGSILQPQIKIHRAGYAELSFSPSVNIWSGDNTDGTITIRSVDLTGYTPGMFDVIVKRNPSINLGETTMANAFELRPQIAERLVRRGGFGGPVNRSQAVGNRLYLSSGPRLVVLDTTNEANPVEIGSIDLLTTIMDFKVQGNYAFVCAQSDSKGAGGSNGFCVVNIAAPAPQLVWSGGALRGITGPTTQSTSYLDPERIWLKGSYAYIASSRGAGLFVFNISNPVVPSFSRSVLTSGGTLADSLEYGSIEIVGSTLYGWSWAPGNPAFLRAYDLGPADGAPVFLGQAQCTNDIITAGGPNRPVSMATAPGLLAFVTDGPDDAYFPHLSIWNMSVPASPALISKTPLDRTLTSLSIASGRLYGAEEEGYTAGATVSGEMVEYPDASRGLVIYDIADPANPALLSTFKTGGSVFGVEASGSRAYVRDHGDGLIIVDTSNPSASMRLGGLFSPSAIRDVARNGDLLYVSDQYVGFTVLNISNPDRPVVVGVYRVNHPADPDMQGSWGIAYGNGRVYLAVGDGSAGQTTAGIDVVDVSDPAHPVLVQAYDAPDRDSFRGLEIDGNILHAGGLAVPPCPACSPACDRCPGTQLCNYSINPADGTISFLGRVQPPAGPALTMTNVANPQTRNGYTFCEFGIIDNRDPANPVLLSSAPLSCGYALAGHSMYTRGTPQSGDTTGVYVWDVSDKANPLGPAPLLGHAEFFYSKSIAANQAMADRLFISGGLEGIVGGRPYGLFVFDLPAQRLIGSMLPCVEGIANLDVNVRTSLLKSSGSLLFSADRVGNYRGNFGQRISQGLLIAEHLRPPVCPADFNGTGGLNVQDIFDFLGAWFAADARADFNHVAGITVQDIFDFLGAWFSGC